MRGQAPRPTLVIIVGIVAFSWASIFVRFCDAPPLIIAAYRMLLTSLFLLPIVLAWFRKGVGELLRGDDLVLCMVAGVFLGLHFAFWVASLAYTSVASSVVFVTTNPVFVALIGHYLLGEQVGHRMVLYIVVILTGGLIIGVQDLQASPAGLYGDSLALVGSFLMSLYLLLSRRLRQRLVLVPYIFVAYTTAAILLVLIAVLMRLPFAPYPRDTVIYFVLLAAVPQLVGHTSFNWALRHLSTTVVAVAFLGEPVGATILAYLLLREVPSGIKLLGATLILGGVYLTLRNQERARVGAVRGSD